MTYRYRIELAATDDTARDLRGIRRLLKNAKRQHGLMCLAVTTEPDFNFTCTRELEMNVNDIFGGTTLSASDLKGGPVTVRIAAVTHRQFNDGDKLEIRFHGARKTLLCNKTNARSIAEMHGTETDDWLGQSITLVASQTDFQGRQVACVRVQMPSRQINEPPAQEPAQRQPLPGRPVRQDESVYEFDDNDAPF